MDKPRFMLDASVIIGHLNNKLDLLGFLEAQGECEVFFNLVSEIETFAKPGMSAEEENAARLTLSQFKRAEIDAATLEITIQIRRAKELLLPDALIAATAITLNTTVLSNDPHLRDYHREGYTALPCGNYSLTI
ncbi:MAG: PIN domain-containing protein [Treponema sp.]|jgi:predicted nucleic acid-binding protein|nr:PIN domain-containing protein [Treponema sp.]